MPIQDVGNRTKDHDSVNATQGMAPATFLDDRLDAPLIDRVVIDGTKMTVHFDRPVISAADATLGWTLVPARVLSVPVMGGNRIEFTLNQAIPDGTAVTIDYGATAGDITSDQGTDLADVDPVIPVYLVNNSGEVLAVLVGTAGTPGAFTPAGAVIPYDLAELIATDPTASPLTLWTVGQNVILGDTNTAHWDSTDWVDGDAPA